MNDVDQPIVIADLAYATHSAGTWTPDEQTINETGVLNFSITATDPDGNTLGYNWKLDGVEVSTTDLYDFITDYTSAGNYIVTLDVTDNFGVSDSIRKETGPTDNVLNYSWNVEVVDADQPIVVTEILPAPGTLTINEMEVIYFSFAGYDPDGNPLEYSWKLDGTEVSTTDLYDFTTNYTSAGTYAVTLDVMDNFGAVDNTLNYVWTVDVIDVDQPIVVTDLSYATNTGGVWVPNNQQINEMDALNFSITATDPNGNPLEYSWKLDGTELSTTDLYDFTTDYTSAGTYIVTLDVTNNFVTRKISGVSRDVLYYEWDITVNDVDQEIVVNELLPAPGTITIDEEDIINLSIDAYDPDGNLLEYSWKLDGVEVSTTNSYDFVTTWQSGDEDYIITLSVADNFGTADNTLDFTWNVHVNDTVESDLIILPLATKLFQNHPNPFNPITEIGFDIMENDFGIFAIYNIKGQQIKIKEYGPGRHNLIWNASKQSSGIYLYELKTKSKREIRKMLLLK